MVPPKPFAIMAAACLKAMLGALARSAIDSGAMVSHRSNMSAMMSVGAGALLKHSSFVFFLLSRSLSRFSSQIGAVAIGWQIYDLTGSAFELGMVGLVQFFPTALFVFVAGQAAGRIGRRDRDREG